MWNAFQRVNEITLSFSPCNVIILILKTTIPFSLDPIQNDIETYIERLHVQMTLKLTLNNYTFKWHQNRLWWRRQTSDGLGPSEIDAIHETLMSCMDGTLGQLRRMVEQEREAAERERLRLMQVLLNFNEFIEYSWVTRMDGCVCPCL